MPNIEIYNEDALVQLPKLESNSIDLIYCDLPYGTTNCKWVSIIPLEDMWMECNRLIKGNGAIIFHAQQPFTSHLIISNVKMFKYSWVWEKSKATGFLNSKIRPLVAHEDILVFSKGKPPYYPQMSKGKPYNKGIRKKQTEDDVYNSYKQSKIKSSGDRYPRSVLYTKTAESEGKTYHKTQKPLSLSEYIIKTYSQENDLILDFTVGSGTSGIASYLSNRISILIEKDYDIFNVMKERIENKLGLSI